MVVESYEFFTNTCEACTMKLPKSFFIIDVFCMRQKCGNCHRFFYVKEVHPLISMSKIWAQGSKSRPRQLAMKECLFLHAPPLQFFQVHSPGSNVCRYIAAIFAKLLQIINSCCQKNCHPQNFLPLFQNSFPLKALNGALASGLLATPWPRDRSIG